MGNDRLTEYRRFVAAKAQADPPTGIEDVPPINAQLFPFQRDIVRWALRRGRACIWADCGLGKTPMQLEWAKHIPGDVLIVAPLAVAEQTRREGEKFHVPVEYSRDGTKRGKVTITNYEMLEHFTPADFAGVVLDESSILKSYTGKFRTFLVQEWTRVPFRLACTATPAPNDFMELGNHAEFTGAMRGSEMLSSYFINDPGNVGRYRLRGHAEKPFYRWMAGWAVMIRKPSDLGYSDDGFTLPPLRMHDVVLDSHKAADGMLFAVDAVTLQ